MQESNHGNHYISSSPELSVSNESLMRERKNKFFTEQFGKNKGNEQVMDLQLWVQNICRNMKTDIHNIMRATNKSGQYEVCYNNVNQDLIML